MIIVMEKNNKYHDAFVWAFEEMGKNQTEFAQIFKYKQPAISLLLKGERAVKLTHLKKIAATMGITHQELIARSKDWNHISSKPQSESKQNSEPNSMIKLINSVLLDIQKIAPEKLNYILEHAQTVRVMAQKEKQDKETSEGG